LIEGKNSKKIPLATTMDPFSMMRKIPKDD